MAKQGIAASRTLRQPSPAFERIRDKGPKELEEKVLEDWRKLTFLQLKHGEDKSSFFGRIQSFARNCLLSVLSVGPLPNHIAFIMDGNRRYAKSQKIEQGSGHRAGFSALISILQYSYEVGVKYVTVYPFSIDNFKRKPEVVQFLIDLMKEKIDELLKEDSIVSKYGVKINFWGDLKLLNEPVRVAAEKAMAVTSRNSGPVLSVCVAYNSTNEILHAVQELCLEKKINGNELDEKVSVADLEQHLYTSSCPEPDLVIRTSGESRLSNFLLWQTTWSQLENPMVLWLDFSLKHFVWAILEYQSAFTYLQNKRIRSEKIH